MFDIPYIPVIVFIAILIPPIILGIVRGWKASLLFGVAMLAMIGIEVALGFIFYDKIWDLLKNVYIGNVKAGLNKDALKEVAKPSVIVLFIGICIPFSYLIFYSIYFPFRNKLKKHLYPKTKDVSENEKEIQRSPKIISRAVGGTLSAAMSLGLASIAATSATALFTPAEKRKAFHRNVSTISKIYTFGKGELNEEVIKLKQFAEMFLTPDVQGYLSDILILGQKANPDMQASATSISSSVFHDELLKMKDDVVSMRALVELILTSDLFVNTPKVTLIDSDYTQYGEWGTQMSQITTQYNDMTNHLNSIQSQNISPQFYLSDSIIDLFTSEIANREIESFDKTGYYLKWDDNKEILEKVKDTKKWLIDQRDAAIGNYNTAIDNLKATYQEQDKLLSALKALGHDKENSADDTYSKSDYQVAAIQSATLQNNIGTIERLINTVINLTKIRDATRVAQNATDISYAGAIDAADGAGGISKGHNDLEAIVKNTKSDLDSKAAELNNIKTDLADLIAEMNKQENIWHTNEAKYNSITQAYLSGLLTSAIAEDQKATDTQTKITIKKGELRTANSNLQTAQGVVTTLESKKRNLDTQIAQSQSTINTNNGNLSTLRNDLATIKSNITNKTNDKNKKEDQITANNITIASLNSQSPVNTAEVSRLTTLNTQLSADVSTLSSEIRSLGTDKTSKETSISTLEAQNSNLTQKINTDKGTLATTVSDLSSANADVTAKQRIVNNLNTTISNLKSEKQGYENKASDFRTTHTTKTNEKSDFQRIFTDAKSIYDNHHVTLVPNKTTERDNKQAEVVAANAKWTKAKSDLASYDSTNNYSSLKSQYESNKRALIDANKNLDKGKADLSDARNNREDIKTQLVNLHQQRNNYVNNLKVYSNTINEKNAFTIPPFTEQRNHWTTGTSNPNSGTVSITKTFDAAKNVQDHDYYTWAQETIPGATDYIANQIKVVANLENIKNNKEFEYNQLKDDYLNTIREILRR